MRNGLAILLIGFGIGFCIFSFLTKESVNTSISSNTGTEIIYTTGVYTTGATARVGFTSGEVSNIMDSDLYYVLERINAVGSPTEDGVHNYFTKISFPEQSRETTNVKENLHKYLEKNLKKVNVKENGYLYIVMEKPIKYIESLGTYQPITIRVIGEIFGSYGRLDITKSIPTKEPNKTFLFKLEDVPIIKGINQDWTISKGEDISVGGFIGSTDGNHIKSIYFVRRQ